MSQYIEYTLGIEAGAALYRFQRDPIPDLPDSLHLFSNFLFFVHAEIMTILSDLANIAYVSEFNDSAQNKIRLSMNIRLWK